MRVSVAVDVSVLFNEPKLLKYETVVQMLAKALEVSVLFNEPKLLKYRDRRRRVDQTACFSALQRAEIAEIFQAVAGDSLTKAFQCSSTSRNC